MSTSEILDKISKLSSSDKILIIEKTLKDLIKANSLQEMTLAAEALENEYRTNPELTVFSSF